MDYDTWKTTDFEAERAAEEELAKEAQIAELSESLFDAYVGGNPRVRDEVEEMITSDEDTCKFMFDNMLAGLKLDNSKPINTRGADSYLRWQSLISGTCLALANREGDRVDQFAREMRL